MRAFSRRWAKRRLRCLGLTATAGLTLIPIGALAQSADGAGNFAKDVDAQIARHDSLPRPCGARQDVLRPRARAFAQDLDRGDELGSADRDAALTDGRPPWPIK